MPPKILGCYIFSVCLAQSSTVASATPRDPDEEEEPPASDTVAPTPAAPQFVPSMLLNQTLLGERRAPSLSESITNPFACGHFELRFKMHIAADGSVSRVVPILGPGSWDPKLLDELRRWRFQPRPTPAWTIQQFGYSIVLPREDACKKLRDRQRFLSPELADAIRRYRIEPDWPQGIPFLKAGDSRTFAYRICVDGEGIVSSAEPIRGFDNDADEEIITRIRKFQYQPVQFPFCTYYLKTWPAPQPITPEKLRAEISNLPNMEILRKKVLNQPEPHLPDSIKEANRGSRIVGVYLLCIGRHGAIDKIGIVKGIAGADDYIMRTLITWKYLPTKIENLICFEQTLEFHIG